MLGQQTAKAHWFQASIYGKTKNADFYMYNGQKRMFIHHETYTSKVPRTMYFKYQSQMEQIDSFLIYSDIIEDQIMGDTYASLMRFCAINGDSDRRVVNGFDIPHYIPLRTRRIPEIKIQIRDLWDNFIKFQTGFIHLKLHFRKRQLI